MGINCITFEIGIYIYFFIGIKKSMASQITVVTRYVVVCAMAYIKITLHFFTYCELNVGPFKMISSYYQKMRFMEILHAYVLCM